MVLFSWLVLVHGLDSWMPMINSQQFISFTCICTAALSSQDHVDNTFCFLIFFSGVTNPPLETNAAHSDTTVAKMLVGNKCDLDNIREVPVEEGKALAEAEGLFFMETSALDATNVKTAFDIVIREIYSNVSRKILNSDSYKAELSLNRVSIDGDSKDDQKQTSRFGCC